MTILKLDKEDGRFTGYHFERDGVTIGDREAIATGFTIEPEIAHWFLVLTKGFCVMSPPDVEPAAMLPVLHLLDPKPDPARN